MILYKMSMSIQILKYFKEFELKSILPCPVAINKKRL